MVFSTELSIEMIHANGAHLSMIVTGIHKTEIEILRNTILKETVKKSKHEQHESQPSTLGRWVSRRAPVSGSTTRPNVPIMVGRIRLLRDWPTARGIDSTDFRQLHGSG